MVPWFLWLPYSICSFFSERKKRLRMAVSFNIFKITECENRSERS